MEFLDTINGKNLYELFKMIIITGAQDLLQFPERKEVYTNDWPENNGLEYDLSVVPKFKDIEATLKCGFICDTEAEYWNSRSAFFSEISDSGFKNLFINDHGKTYQFFYRKSDNFEIAKKRLKNTEKILVKFDLTITVKNGL